MYDRATRRGGLTPGGRRAVRKWGTALVLAGLLVGLRYAPWPQLTPAKHAIAIWSGRSMWPTPLARWASARWREAHALLRWPPITGGTTVVAVPPPLASLALPVSGVLLAPFGPGTDPLTARPANLPGLLVRTAAGAAVRAPASGEVVSVAASPPLGYHVTLRIAPDVVTSVIGVSDLAVKSGQTVAQGALLGHVPAPGANSVPHVLISVERDGHLVDPLSPLYYGPSA